MDITKQALDNLYPSSRAPEAADQLGESKPTDHALSDEEAAQKLYPDRTDGGRFPRVADNKLLDCIRAVSGEILIQQQYFGDTAAMASAHANELGGANLEDVPVKNLDRGCLHDAKLGKDCAELSLKWADCRNLDVTDSVLDRAQFDFSDIRGMRVSSETSIACASFVGCRIDGPTLEALKRCKGAHNAKGLVLNDWAGARV